LKLGKPVKISDLQLRGPKVEDSLTAHDGGKNDSSCMTSEIEDHEDPGENEEGSVSEAEAEGDEKVGDEDRKNWQEVSCPHKSRRHYAKSMCINCYHRRGRTKKAWACVHVEKLHYSKGLCQNCYLAKYYRQRKEKKQRDLEAKNSFV